MAVMVMVNAVVVAANVVVAMAPVVKVVTAVTVSVIVRSMATTQPVSRRYPY